MSLERCKECKKKVSSEASTCPHCGVSSPYIPPPPPKPVTKREKMITLVVIIAILIGILALCENLDEKRKAKLAEKLQTMPEDCKGLIILTVAMKNDHVRKWGKKHKWEDDSFYFVSWDVGLKGKRISGKHRLAWFRVTCLLGKFTHTFKVTSIQDLQTKETHHMP